MCKSCDWNNYGDARKWRHATRGEHLHESKIYGTSKMPYFAWWRGCKVEGHHLWTAPKYSYNPKNRHPVTGLLLVLFWNMLWLRDHLSTEHFSIFLNTGLVRYSDRNCNKAACVVLPLSSRSNQHITLVKLSSLHWIISLSFWSFFVQWSMLQCI